MRIAIALVLLVLSAPLVASQEGILTLDRLSLESSGIGESGPVKVSGTQTRGGVTSLRVEAFGKTIQLSPTQLKELDGGQYNLVQLSYEGGYREPGGRTIYIRLAKGFTSGEVNAVVVVVTEDGKVKITKESRRAA